MKTQIAIIDDNNFLINSVKEKLSFFDDIAIVYTANNGTECLDKLKQGRRVDLILMDIEMPTLDGIATTAQVKQLYPQIKIIMLTVFDDDENIFKAIQAGADGYLLKDIDPETLFNSIVQTMEGGAAMTPSIALKALNLLRSPLTPEGDEVLEKVKLSKREVEVLKQLATGLTARAIAENLYISPSTVRKHIENIYQKLQAHSKIEAVEKARKQRLI